MRGPKYHYEVRERPGKIDNPFGVYSVTEETRVVIIAKCTTKENADAFCERMNRTIKHD